ncbi:hypothetical protein [Shimia biformata]|uniref:hypothetical protein n=1 Tax=Shimia biformata TaxID=1294299 RepID=UPI001950CC49|nr:hypothetical protein [Shimia biformata]
MTFADHINALRADMPGCRLVAFGDASTRLVLRASHGPDIRREHLDRLCDEASACFSMADVADGSPSGAKEALVLTHRDLRVYVRSPDNDADFLCIQCDPDCDPETVVRMGHDTLKGLTDF